MKKTGKCDSGKAGDGPAWARVRCLCGELVRVGIGGRRVACSCGVRLWIKQGHDGTCFPWSYIQEDSLRERKQAGHPVKHIRPKIVEWGWKDGAYARA
jgi:hypothetical protein